MPTISSYADIVRDWEQLLTAAQESSTELTEAERHRAALAQHLEAVKALKAKQDSARAEKQENTRELKRMLAEGRDLAIRLRGAVKASMGPRSERLVKFGLAPLRKRRKTPESGSVGGATLPPAGAGKPEIVD